MYERVNMKSVIIVTSLAAVISVIAGGIGGVSTGTLLIRAVAFAVLFAVGTALINIVVDTYLPELKNSEPSPSPGEEDTGEGDNARGRNVDIVMDDGEGMVPSGPDRGEDSLSGDDDGGDMKSDSSYEESDGAFVPVSPEKSFSGRGGVLPDIGVFSSADEEEEDEPESLAAVEGGGDSGLDDRPRSRYAAMQTTDEEKIDFFHNNTTAEELAKGVRTMLKSDEKG